MMSCSDATSLIILSKNEFTNTFTKFFVFYPRVSLYNLIRVDTIYGDWTNLIINSCTQIIASRNT